jgi:hypothetical protein
MTDKLPYDFSVPGILSGTQEGSVYTKIASIPGAVLAVKPHLFIVVASIPVLCVGGRLRAELTSGEFPVVPYEKIQSGFGFPELEPRSEKHMSVQFGMTLSTPMIMSHYIWELMDKHQAIPSIVDSVLSRFPKTVTVLMPKDQLLELFSTLLEDQAPNVLPGDILPKLYFGSDLKNATYDPKPKFIPIKIKQ